MTLTRRMLIPALLLGLGLAVASAETATVPRKGSLRVNINTATELQLQSLPHIGPTLAESIVLGRPYRRVADLARVKGISRQMVRELTPLLTVHDPTGPAPSRKRP